MAVTPDCSWDILSNQRLPVHRRSWNGCDRRVRSPGQRQVLGARDADLLKQLTTPAVFRKITWTNGAKLLKRSA